MISPLRRPDVEPLRKLGVKRIAAGDNAIPLACGQARLLRDFPTSLSISNRDRARRPPRYNRALPALPAEASVLLLNHRDELQATRCFPRPREKRRIDSREATNRPQWP